MPPLRCAAGSACSGSSCATTSGSVTSKRTAPQLQPPVSGRSVTSRKAFLAVAAGHEQKTTAARSAILGPRWSSTSSTAPTSCSATSTAAAAAAGATVSRSAPRPACCTRCCRCSRPARRTSASRPITSSSPSATTSGRATRPAPASIPRCAPSSCRSRRRSRPWASLVWPMVELEADDALAAAARIASEDDAVQQVCIWTPDKDLAQCVRGDEVVQVDRRSNSVRNAAGVREKFGVDPERHPRPAGARRRRGRRLPGHSRHRQGHGGAARQPPRRDRGIPARGARRQARARAAVQGPRDAASLRARCCARSTSSAGAARQRRSTPGRSDSATAACSTARSRSRADEFWQAARSLLACRTNPARQP